VIIIVIISIIIINNNNSIIIFGGGDDDNDDDTLRLLGLQQLMRQNDSRQTLCCIKVTVVSLHIYDVSKRLFILRITTIEL
jgi:hypothetical protein